MKWIMKMILRRLKRIIPARFIKSLQSILTQMQRRLAQRIKKDATTVIQPSPLPGDVVSLFLIRDRFYATPVAYSKI
jgi:hypothetical protein